jgi:hypothetical protein
MLTEYISLEMKTFGFSQSKVICALEHMARVSCTVFNSQKKDKI